MDMLNFAPDIADQNRSLEQQSTNAQVCSPNTGSRSDNVQAAAMLVDLGVKKARSLRPLGSSRTNRDYMPRFDTNLLQSVVFSRSAPFYFLACHLLYVEK